MDRSLYFLVDEEIAVALAVADADGVAAGMIRTPTVTATIYELRTVQWHQHIRQARKRR